MADKDKTDEILVHLQYIRENQDKTNQHLATLNGRVGASENRLTALETRSDEGKRDGRNWGAAGGFLGGFLASLIAKWAGGQ